MLWKQKNSLPNKKLKLKYKILWILYIELIFWIILNIESDSNTFMAYESIND